MKKYIALLVLLVMALAACGGSGTFDDGESTDAGMLALETSLTLDAAIFDDLDSAAATAVQTVEDQEVGSLARAWGLPTVAVRMLRAWGVRLPHPGDADGSCSISVDTHGYADADEDGVFDQVDANFDCGGSLEDGRTFAISGGFHFTDAEGAYAGFSMNLDDFSVVMTRSSGEHSIERSRVLNGSVGISGSPAEGYALQKDLTINYAISVDGEVVHEAQWSGQKTKTYTPDDPEAPAAGGVVSISGGATLTRDGQTTEFAVSSSTDEEGETPLHWSRECWRNSRDAGRLGHIMGGYDAGWILHQNLTNGNYTKITYNACGSVSVEKNF